MKNPLVVFLGIGHYTQMKPLLGVARDLRSVKVSFCATNGYTLFFAREKDKEPLYVCLDGQTIATTKYQPEDVSKLKLSWTEDDIRSFNKEVGGVLSSNNFDGLIYIISCHGHNNNEIITSDGEEVVIDDEIFQRFGNEKCAALRGKPKVVFIDACTGSTPKKLHAIESYVGTGTATYGESIHNDHVLIKNSHTYNNIQQSNKNSKNDNNSADSKENDESYKHTQVRVVSSREAAFYLEGRDLFVVYASLKGYAIVDGGVKGGYLIRSITKSMKEIVGSRKNRGKSFPLYTLIKLCQGFMEYMVSKMYTETGAVNTIEINDSLTCNLHIQSRFAP